MAIQKLPDSRLTRMKGYASICETRQMRGYTFGLFAPNLSAIMPPSEIDRRPQSGYVVHDKSMNWETYLGKAARYRAGRK